MPAVVTGIVKALTEMDHVGTRVEGEKTVYTFKTTCLSPSLVETKSKILSVLDFPVDIPEDVNVQEVKHGIIFKEYLVDIICPRRKIGKPRDLIAKKYPVMGLRRRKYSGEP